MMKNQITGRGEEECFLQDAVPEQRAESGLRVTGDWSASNPAAKHNASLMHGHKACNALCNAGLFLLTDGSLCRK